MTSGYSSLPTPETARVTRYPSRAARLPVYSNRSGKVVTSKVRLSTHSMSKTSGYAMHAAGVSLEQICKVLSHSHPKVTMRYIGLDDAAIQQSYQDFVL